MNRICFKPEDLALNNLSKATFPEECNLKNLGVMVSHYSGGEDYVILCDGPSGSNISAQRAVDWIKKNLPKGVPLEEDRALGVVSQELGGKDRKCVRRYFLFHGDVVKFYSQIEADSIYVDRL